MATTRSPNNSGNRTPDERDERRTPDAERTQQSTASGTPQTGNDPKPENEPSRPSGTKEPGTQQPGSTQRPGTSQNPSTGTTGQQPGSRADKGDLNDEDRNTRRTDTSGDSIRNDR